MLGLRLPQTKRPRRESGHPAAGSSDDHVSLAGFPPLDAGAAGAAATSAAFWSARQSRALPATPTADLQGWHPLPTAVWTSTRSVFFWVVGCNCLATSYYNTLRSMPLATLADDVFFCAATMRVAPGSPWRNRSAVFPRDESGKPKLESWSFTVRDTPAQNFSEVLSPGPIAATQEDSFSDLISIESDDEDDDGCALVPVASVHAEVVLCRSNRTMRRWPVLEARLRSNLNLKSNWNATRSSRVPSHSQIPLSRSLSKTDGSGCPVVDSPAGVQPHDGESWSFGEQLDLVAKVLTVSTAAAGTRTLSTPVPAKVSPNPLPSPQWCLKITAARTLVVSPSSPLERPLTTTFSWVSLPFSACRPPLSAPPFSSVTATPKVTLALQPPRLSPTPCLSSSLTTSFVSLAMSAPLLPAPAPLPPSLTTPLSPLPKPVSTRRPVM